MDTSPSKKNYYKPDKYRVMLINYNKYRIKHLSCVTQFKQVLSKTFQEYSPSAVFLSFNGGKDCTVLLHFVIQLFRELRFDSRQLICVHVQPAHPFDEVEQFVRNCEKHYNVAIQNRHGSIKETLFNLCNEQKELKACLMGCRRTDPYCSNLDTFQVKSHFDGKIK